MKKRVPIVIDGQVACNGCTACCEGDAVRLTDRDPPGHYQSEPHPYLRGARMLAHQADGRCIYLGRGGCTIHATKPYMCRTMDCRLVAQKYSFAEARSLAKANKITLKVWRAGKDRLD